MVLGSMSVGIDYNRPQQGKSGYAIRLQLNNPQNKRTNSAINGSISAQHFSKSYQSLHLDNHYPTQGAGY